MRKLSLILLAAGSILLILNGCVSVTPPSPGDPYIEGPSYLRINEEGIYRIVNLKNTVNKEEIRWMLLPVDNVSSYYRLGKGVECKVIITEEMIKKTIIHKTFSLVAYYEDNDKTESVSKYIHVIIENK
jgi:hypothetical protein